MTISYKKAVRLIASMAHDLGSILEEIGSDGHTSVHYGAKDTGAIEEQIQALNLAFDEMVHPPWEGKNEQS